MHDLLAAIMRAIGIEETGELAGLPVLRPRRTSQTPQLRSATSLRRDDSPGSATCTPISAEPLDTVPALRRVTRRSTSLPTLAARLSHKHSLTPRQLQICLTLIIIFNVFFVFSKSL